eukprot:CAMPEP_0185727910 /NCGR_PEP_ID=MMETSP1171-20130828/3451_1 /TAXON_ID=374046 /ORGANISM="Helicotheca tamensis, Strain CCMP826" /LENGTH=267 /DNA_ID=CAMNT_0028396555 /DNA_START=237 /DNA_END=1040 /DNA_ORIENTATION=-
MTGNCLGWVAYSFVEFNLFVFFANAPGFILSFWLNSGALKLQYLEQVRPYIERDMSPSPRVRESNNIAEEEEEESVTTNEEDEQSYRQGGGSGPPLFCTHDKVWLLVVVSWLILLSVIGLDSSLTHEIRKDIVGIAANVNLVVFFAAPLSTIVTVLKTADSSSIHVRTMVLNTLNCVFWFAYSLAVRDIFIALPNGLGLLFGLIQVVLYVIFPRSDGGLERIRTDEESMEDGLMMENGDGNRSVGSDGSVETELKRKSSIIEDKSII